MARFEYTVTPEEAAHYNELREARGWSWETLADYFDRCCGADPSAPFYAEWARAMAEATPEKRGKRAATTGDVEKR